MTLGYFEIYNGVYDVFGEDEEEDGKYTFIFLIETFSLKDKYNQKNQRKYGLQKKKKSSTQTLNSSSWLLPMELVGKMNNSKDVDIFREVSTRRCPNYGGVLQRLKKPSRVRVGSSWPVAFGLNGVPDRGSSVPAVLSCSTGHRHPAAVTATKTQNTGVSDVHFKRGCPPLLFRQAGGQSTPTHFSSALLPREEQDGQTILINAARESKVPSTSEL